jgi:tRNA(Arg) A34 adenosine deaminase TadA
MLDTSQDKKLLKAALEVAKRSWEKGNLPFGCVLASPDGKILDEGENTVVTDNDSIAHCEINLVHQMAGKYEQGYLRDCSVYASTEPCPMCTGAIFWSGIGRIVFALSKEAYHSIAGTTNPAYLFDISTEKLLSFGKRAIKVSGPLLEEEASALYKHWLSR